MKTLKSYIDSVVDKVLNESLDEMAEDIINRIKSESDEDDYNKGGKCNECGGMMREGECSECGYTMESMYEDDYNKGGKCNECGGMMREGECSECGYTMESIYELEVDDEYFDYDEDDKWNAPSPDDDDEYFDEYFDELYIPDDMPSYKTKYRYSDEDKGGLDEEKKLSKGQKYIAKQAKPTNKIDANDFKKLRMKKRETKEGKKFPDLSGDGKVTRKDILMGRGVKLNGKKKTNESIRLREEEMIDLIEKIVNEEKNNIKKQSSHPGTSTFARNFKKSGEENKDYIKSVTKKIKEYLKNGSKGDFDFEPKIFPKGNGELAKMDKKTYKPTPEVEEYIENFSSAGLENLVFDEIHPNEAKMDEYMEGSSKAGNNPKWANAVETDVNERRNKVRKRNLLGILKKKESYNRQVQPVSYYKKNSEEEKDVARIFQALESKEDKKERLLKEDIEKMNNLLAYNKKTQ